MNCGESYEMGFGNDAMFATWDKMPNEHGSVHDTVSESVDSETLRKRKTSSRQIDSHSRWTGYSPDECYSPASPSGAPPMYTEEPWRSLPDNTPSAEEKVAQWMSSEKPRPQSDCRARRPVSPLALGEIQDRRSRGRRSRSIIMRFEEEQKLMNEEAAQYRAVSSEARLPTQDSRINRQSSMDSISKSGGIEKPLPNLPKKASLEIPSARTSNRQSISEQYPLFMAPSQESNDVSELHLPPLVPMTYSDLSPYNSTSSKVNPILPTILSTPPTQPPTTSSNLARSLSPDSLQPDTKVSPQDKQRYTMPAFRDEALKNLENSDEETKRTFQHNRTQSDNLNTDLMRETFGLATEITPVPKASVEQIETLLRKPVPVDQPERPRPTPIDMGAVLEANKDHLQQQIAIYTEMQKRDSGVDCRTPVEMLYSQHPSALIPRPLSLPVKKNAGHEEDVIPMSPIERLEADHDRFMRHRKFFDNRPLQRCLDGDGVNEISELLFDRLLEETSIYDAKFSEEHYQRRAFWDSVRMELNMDDDEFEDNIMEEHKPKRTGTLLKRKNTCKVAVHPAQ